SPGCQPQLSQLPVTSPNPKPAQIPARYCRVGRTKESRQEPPLIGSPPAKTALERPGRRLLHQPPARSVGGQCGVALVAVVHLVHFFDGVEVADNVGRTEGFAGLHRLAVDLLDHDDDPPGTLAAPRLVDDTRSERQTGEPGAVFAPLLV